MIHEITEQTEAVLNLAHALKKEMEKPLTEQLLGRHWTSLRSQVKKFGQKKGMLLDPSDADLCRFVLEMGVDDLAKRFRNIGPCRAKALFDEAVDYLDEEIQELNACW